MDEYNEDGTPKRVVVTDTSTKVGAGAAGAGMGIAVFLIAVVLAVAGWFWYNGKTDTPASVSRDAGSAVSGAVNSTVDAAKEVPQAAKDAVTPGDQPTTRPNADGSTKSLDQK